MNPITTNQTLFDRGGLRLSVSSVPDPAAVDLLCSTLWGSPGGTRYQHLDTRTRILEIQDPKFLHLNKGDEIMGVMNMSGRRIASGNTAKQSWYIRYFSMKEAIQRKGKDLGTKAGEVRDSLLKRSARDLFVHPEKAGMEKGVFYAYVALDNPRSKAMCEMMGFSPVRRFSTLAFSRIFPRKHPRARQVSDIERDFVKGRIVSQYASHGFFPSDIDFIDDKYWVLTQYSLPIAGLRAIPVNWRVNQLPGKRGKWLLKTLPKIPLLNKLFNPDKFNFLAIEAMFCGTGYEKHLHQLLEHVCAVHRLNTALFWMDEQDGFRARMLEAGSLGLLQRFHTSGPVDIIALGLEGNAIEKVRPAYIGARDLV